MDQITDLQVAPGSSAEIKLRCVNEGLASFETDFLQTKTKRPIKLRRKRSAPKPARQSSNSLMLQHIKHTRLLTREEEIQLAKAIEEGRDKILRALAETPLFIEEIQGLLNYWKKGKAYFDKVLRDPGSSCMDEPASHKHLARLFQKVIDSYQKNVALEIQLRQKPSNTHRESIQHDMAQNRSHIHKLLHTLGLSPTFIRDLATSYQDMVHIALAAKENLEQVKRQSGMSLKELRTVQQSTAQLDRKQKQELAKLHQRAQRASRRLRQVEQDCGMSLSRLRRIHRQIHEGEAISHQALKRMVESNLRLVAYVARRYQHRAKGMQLSDLIQEGSIGLMKAIDKFDHRKGVKFATYATWWIRQSIGRAICDQSRIIRLPVKQVEYISKIFHASNELVNELGREPSLDEIAKKVKMPVNKIRRTLRGGLDAVSLQSAAGLEGDRELMDFIEDERITYPEEEAADNDLTEKMHQALATLTPREQIILRMRFGIGDQMDHTLKEIGEKFSLTRERIRQIEAAALAKLRHAKQAKHLQPFFSKE